MTTELNGKYGLVNGVSGGSEKVLKQIKLFTCESPSQNMNFANHSVSMVAYRTVENQSHEKPVRQYKKNDRNCDKKCLLSKSTTNFS